jgi:hypothetical protein
MAEPKGKVEPKMLLAKLEPEKAEPKRPEFIKGFMISNKY